MITYQEFRRLLFTAFPVATLAIVSMPVSAAADEAQTGPDVKVYAFLVKKRGLTDEQFHAHWREPHGRLTKKVPQIKRYLQNHGIGSVPTVPGLQPTPYLGIPTIWLDNLGKLEEMPKDPGYTEVHEDELNLMERDQLAFWVTRETVLSAGPAPDDIASIPTKVMLFLKQRPEVAIDEFQRVVAATATSAVRMRSAGRVLYALSAADAYPGDARPLFDGVIEVSFADDRSYEKAWKRSGKGILKSLSAVADIDASRGFLAHEERVIWPPFAR